MPALSPQYTNSSPSSSSLDQTHTKLIGSSIGAMATMEALFWPDLIVLGGGASAKLAKYSSQITVKAPVVPASFLNQAGIVGAALCAETCLKSAQ